MRGMTVFAQWVLTLCPHYAEQMLTQAGIHTLNTATTLHTNAPLQSDRHAYIDMNEYYEQTHKLLMTIMNRVSNRSRSDWPR